MIVNISTVYSYRCSLPILSHKQIWDQNDAIHNVSFALKLTDSLQGCRGPEGHAPKTFAKP